MRTRFHETRSWGTRESDGISKAISPRGMSLRSKETRFSRSCIGSSEEVFEAASTNSQSPHGCSPSKVRSIAALKPYCPASPAIIPAQATTCKVVRWTPPAKATTTSIRIWRARFKIGRRGMIRSAGMGSNGKLIYNTALTSGLLPQIISRHQHDSDSSTKYQPQWEDRPAPFD